MINFRNIFSIVAGEPCPLCDRVKFCSEKCQKLALNTYHLIECPILQALWESGISITCLMALRIISQKNPQYFVDLENILMVCYSFFIQIISITTITNRDDKLLFNLMVFLYVRKTK